MSAWLLVKYYRDRLYLESVTRENQELPPVLDTASLAFAERLRGPLLYTYYAGWVGVATAGLMLTVPSILQR